MAIHNEAKIGDIADTILLPGDPQRAKYIAEKYLTDFYCYNNVRGMLGYTGYFNSKRVSIQGTGMGMPSHSIYVTELIETYGVNNLIRIGSCGAIQEEIKLMDIVITIGACTDSNMNKLRFNNCDFSPVADFSLLTKAWNTSLNQKKNVKTGTILSSDFFYEENFYGSNFKSWKEFGVLGVDMETAALYTLAAKYRKKALSILTVSDHIIRKEALSSEQRLLSFNSMIELAFECI